MTDKPPQDPPQPPIPAAPGSGDGGPRGSQPPGGLSSRAVAPVRHAIPTAQEGEALFENLFDEVLDGQGASGHAPKPRGAVAPGNEPTLGEAVAAELGATPAPGSVLDVDEGDVELVDSPAQRAPAPARPVPIPPPPGMPPGVGRSGPLPGYPAAPVPLPRPAPPPGGPRPFGPVGGIRPNIPVRPAIPQAPQPIPPPPGMGAPARQALPAIPAPGAPPGGIPRPLAAPPTAAGYPAGPPPAAPQWPVPGAAPVAAPPTPGGADSEPPQYDDEATQLFDSSRGNMAAILASARAERAAKKQGPQIVPPGDDDAEVPDDAPPIAFSAAGELTPPPAAPASGAGEPSLAADTTGAAADASFEPGTPVTPGVAEPRSAPDAVAAPPDADEIAFEEPVFGDAEPEAADRTDGAEGEAVAAMEVATGSAEAGGVEEPAPTPASPAAQEETWQAEPGDRDAAAEDAAAADGGQELGEAALASAAPDQSEAALTDDESASLAAGDEEDGAALTDEEAAAIAAQDFDAEGLDAEQAADAVVTLVQSGQRDAWFARAQWLYEEAPPPENAPERTTALLVVAELFAMCGDEVRAEEVAREALALSPSCPIARRQLRQLLAARGDWLEVLELLDAEVKLAPSPEAQAHAAALGSTVARLGVGDPEGSARRLKQLGQLQPADLRPTLFHFAHALATTDEVPTVDWPADAGAEELTRASAVLAAMRSDGTVVADPTTPLGAAFATRAALRRRDIPAAIQGLQALSAVPRLDVGCFWLLASLAAPHPSLRPQAIEALSRVSEGSHGAIALKTRALRALEAGDAAAAVHIANTAGEDVLGAADRLILAGLTATPLDRLGAWLQAAAEVEDYAPLAAAAAAALTDPRDGERPLPSVGSPAARAADLLGRQLAAQATSRAGDSSLREANEARLRDAAQSLADADEHDGVARAVLVELAHGAGEVARLVELLLQDRPADGPLAREQALAAALFAEISGNRERFRMELDRVRHAIPGDAMSLRMWLAQVDAIGAAHELVRHAEHADEPTSAALALTEAALLYAGEGRVAESDPLLRRAAELAPDFALPASAGWIEAQRLDNAEAERFWLQLRLDATTEPADRVFDLVRIAWRLGDADDAAERARLVAEAHQARPTDMTLRDLAERWAPDAIPSRGAWLMDRVGEGQPDAAPLALEAALRFEADEAWAEAAAAAARATELGDGALAPLFEQRYALRGLGADAVVSKLASQYEATTDATVRRELAEQLARIELEGRDDRERGLGWLRAALDNEPTSLTVLCRLERLLDSGKEKELACAVATQLARQLDGRESLAHAMLAARMLEHMGRWADAGELVDLAHRVRPANLWTLRQAVGHARARGDHATLRSVHLDLAERTRDPMEQATIVLRAAEATIALGDDAEALGLLDRAIDLWADHYVARWMRAELVERMGDLAEAAAAYEQLAGVSQDQAQRVDALHRAATLWLSFDSESARSESRRLLEAVVAIDPSHADSFERLRTIYVAAGAKSELAELLDARLQTVTDPQARAEMEVVRGKILAEAGASAEARAALEAAIAAYPNNLDALGAYADVCAAEQDWPAVEQTLIDLGRLAADPTQQVAVYLRLGELYGVHLPNPERAELAYTEVLSLDPNNVEARVRLVDLYLNLGDTTRAFEQQAALIDTAVTPKEQCERVVRMAEIYDIAGDQKQAEATLVKARRSFPREPGALTALCEYYQRHGQEDVAAKTLERSAAEVRRALGAGRFEADLFSMLASIAEMSGDKGTSEIAHAALAALEGRHTSVSGLGAAAGSEALDSLLAPDVFTEGFRKLLRASGSLLELAEPLDLASLRAKPFGEAQADLAAHTQELAKSYGVTGLSLFVSASVGPTCLPVSSDSPQLVFGSALLEIDDMAARDFLIHRALKLIQTRTATLARTAPIDLWPLVAAYLKLHSPSFNPPGVDARRLAGYHTRMAQHAKAPDPKVSLLAAEVISAIGNRASSLNAMASAWGSRAALLAIGDPFVALLAVAWAAGTPQGPPAEGEERVKWVARKAEARDIIVFLLSEEYAKARATAKA